MLRTKLVVTGATVFTAALTTLALAAPAMAGNHGTPSPTPSVTQTVTPTPTPTVSPHRLRPEQWDINLASDSVSGLNVNDVSALGPVFIRGGTDITVSDVLDQLDNGFGSNVNVDHPALGLPTIDRRVCEASIVQTDQPWRFNGGTGLFRRAIGSGVYNLNAEFSFRTFRGRCSLGNLTPAQVLAIINGSGNTNASIAAFCHRHRLPTPVLLSSDVFVQATGTAAVRHHHHRITLTAASR